MRKCRNSVCSRTADDEHETTCIKCGWITDAVPEAPLVAGEKRVNSGRHREQLSNRD